LKRFEAAAPQGQNRSSESILAAGSAAGSLRSPEGKQAPSEAEGSCQARHVGASFISLAPISFEKSERTHAAAPPFPQKVTLAAAVRL